MEIKYCKNHNINKTYLNLHDKIALRTNKFLLNK